MMRALLTTSERAALERLGWAAYFAVREALLDRDNVRVYVRDGDPRNPARTDLVTVIADEFADVAERRDTVHRRGIMVAALGNADEPEVLAHQARAFAKLFAGHNLTGAEASADVGLGWARP